MSAIVVFTQTLQTSVRSSFGAPSNVANPGCVARIKQPSNITKGMYFLLPNLHLYLRSY